MRTILTFFIVTGLLAAAGCGTSGGDREDYLDVVVTTPQAADLVRAVVGDRGAVTQILAANSDPHDYEPRPSDAAALAEADLIVRSGGDVDEWLDQLIESAGSDAPVLALSEHVRLLEGDDGADPHWWQDPANGALAVAAVAAELGRIAPGDATAFAAGGRRYAAELRELDRRIAACLRAVPATQRKLVTGHDSLGYYARRYGIETVGAAIPALTTQAQASVGETAELVDLIRAEDVTTVFPEAGVSPELEEAIAAEAGARVGDELWADTLGPPGSGAATYLGSLAANTETLVDGFTGGASSCGLGG